MILSDLFQSKKRKSSSSNLVLAVIVVILTVLFDYGGDTVFILLRRYKDNIFKNLSLITCIHFFP